MLDLIKMLMAQNRVDEARTYLDRAVRSSNLPAVSDLQRSAVLLAQQGQVAQAIAMLQPIADSLDASGNLIYAELLRNRGDKLPPPTGSTRKLLRRSGDHPAAVHLVGRRFLPRPPIGSGSTLGKKILAKLNDPRFSAGDRTAIMARFDELYLSKDAARDLLAAAADQSPNDADAWRALIEFYIRTNQFDGAIAAADKGLAKLPDNKKLSTLKAQAKALASTKSNPDDLRPLIDALSEDPENAAQVEMLKAIQDEKETKQSPQQVIAKLKTVADKYPNYWPLQQRLVQKYLELNQPNDAAVVAERLMNARPNDPDAARLAVVVYRSAQRWRDAKRAAERWAKRRCRWEHPTEADIAIAEADLALKDPQGASDRLAPYMQSVYDQPQKKPVLTAAVVKLLVASDKLAEARALLQPLLGEGPTCAPPAGFLWPPATSRPRRSRRSGFAPPPPRFPMPRTTSNSPLASCWREEMGRTT